MTPATMINASQTHHQVLSSTRQWYPFKRAPAHKSDYGCVHALFERIDFTQEIYQARPFTRLKQFKYLSRTNQLDEDFSWR
jgi:hypothetical protein